MFKYILEIKLTSFYIFVTLIFAFIISFYKLQSLIVLFYYPIAKIFYKKLLILHISDLFNSSFLISISVCCFFSVLSFDIFLKLFFFSSWYKVQKKIIKFFYVNNLLFFFLYTLFFFLIYSFFIRYLLIWDFKTFNSYKLFDIQFQIVKFVQFQIHLFFSGLLILLLIFTLSSNLKLFISWKNIFLYIKILKKILFIFFLFFFLLILYDIYLQFFSLVFLFIFLEIISIYICYKLVSFL
nr:SecY-independent protein translocase component tatC [Neorhodomela munita]